MNSSSPSYPLHSFLGGISLAVSVHSFLVLNGSVLGISGFLHRSVKGDTDSLLATGAMVASGALIGLLDSTPLPLTNTSLYIFSVSGAFVGLGTKLANGCTSGHMLCGLSRLSPRSLAAVATFFTTASITANIAYPSLAPAGLITWQVTKLAQKLLLLELTSLATSLYLYWSRSSTDKQPSWKRSLALLNSLFSFGLGMHLTGMTSEQTIIRFLRLPLPGHISQFDPSLLFLAAGALPTVIGLYQSQAGVISEEKDETRRSIPALGGSWRIPNNITIDARLLVGSALFGIGWGLLGGCPGPELVNLGRALSQGSTQSIIRLAVWLGSATLAGSLSF